MKLSPWYKKLKRGYHNTISIFVKFCRTMTRSERKPLDHLLCRLLLSFPLVGLIFLKAEDGIKSHQRSWSLPLLAYHCLAFGNTAQKATRECGASQHRIIVCWSLLSSIRTIFLKILPPASVWRRPESGEMPYRMQGWLEDLPSLCSAYNGTSLFILLLLDVNAVELLCLSSDTYQTFLASSGKREGPHTR